MLRRLPLALALLAGCTEPPPAATPPAPAPPGVTFTWPKDGQGDVVTGTRIVVHFSGAPEASALGPCTVGSGGVTGAFCLVGERGLAVATPQVFDDTITLSPAGGLDADSTYRLYARPALLPDAGNLPADAPLITFHTRADRAVAGTPLAVAQVNDEPPSVFFDGGPGPALPLLDAASIRVLFSEPLDEASATAGTVQLFRVDGPGREAAVAGTLLVKGARLTFDPDQDLDPSKAYHLHLGALADRGGEAMAPLDLLLHPRAKGNSYPQELAFAPAVTAGTPPARSELSGLPINTTTLSSALIGENTLGLTGGGLQVALADPAAFGGPIPMILRKGQQLALQSLPIRFGGVLESGHQTGPIHLTVLADSVGFITRSPWRAPGQVPDDASPPFVDITLDVALTSDDPLGNVLSTQTLLGLRLLGTSGVDGDQLVVEQFGATEIGTLGIAAAPSNLALRLRTGASVSAPGAPAPALIASFPAAGASDFPAGERIELAFSAPLDAASAVPGPALSLTENGAGVAIGARVDGSVLIIAPARRLADGAQLVLTYGPLAGAGGVAGPSGTLAFSTVAWSAASPAAPVVLSLIPGAPCALAGASAPGSCAGGLASDPSYLPFGLEANRSINAAFSQPMDPATLALGAQCGAGAVRVELLDQSGACAQPVSGTLQKSDRGFRFTPSRPWLVGGSYRLTLVAGPDGSCDPGELCSLAGMPLNTTPLGGFASGVGGRDIVIPFAGLPATADSYQPLATNPVADENGNGQLDPGEVARDGNRVAIEIAGTGGIVTSASLNGDDCLPTRAGQQVCLGLRAEMPASVGRVLPSCPLDANAQPATSAGPCLEVRLWPNLILSTSMSMNTTALGLVPINDLPTGAMLMRTREGSSAQVGYIMNEPGVGDPQFVVHQQVWVDTPDLRILGGLVSHDLKSKPLEFDLKGPVTFLPDGRMQVAVKNLADVPLRVNISALLSGHIDLRIPAGELHITLVGPLLR